MLGTPPFTRGDAVLQAGEELLQEFGDPQELRVAINKAVEAVEEVEDQSRERRERSRERGRHWREAMPEIAEAMLAPQEQADEPYWRQRMPEGLAEAMAPPANERWPARDIAAMCSDLGINPNLIDFPSIAREREAALAYISPPSLIRGTGQLHRDLGIPEGEPLPADQIKAAARQPGDVGHRARLALRLRDQARRSARR
jgi:hypothetical protein